jgi:2-polyprenyl-3-methyl-5-hydroxy-6-metoxy-1,4-benzoquinol methylase
VKKHSGNGNVGLPIAKEKNKKELYEEEVYEHCAKICAEKLDPLQSAQGRERIIRTLELLEKHCQIAGSTIADLGCGSGVIASQLASKGALVTAVDAIERSLLPNFKKVCIPYLPFSDEAFDGLVFTDVIAEITPHHYRLTLSELNRLLNKKGWLIISTPLDLYSHDAYDQFIQLIRTEFEIIESSKSYHRLHFYLNRIASAPRRFIQSSEQASYRLRQLQKRSGLMRLWLYLNSTKFVALLWRPVALFFKPLEQGLKKSQRLLLFAEALSEILWGKGALTHIIVLARKRRI